MNKKMKLAEGDTLNLTADTKNLNPGKYHIKVITEHPDGNITSDAIDLEILKALQKRA